MAQGKCKACKTLYQNQGLLIAGYCKMCASTQIPLLQAEVEQHRWIPVGERLPEESGEYLVVRKGNRYPTTREYEKGMGWVTHDIVTHYKPIILPEGE